MVSANFNYNSDFSKVTADIQNLVREATQANSVFVQLNKTAAAAKMEAARSFAASADAAGFKTTIVDLTGATENFGQALMKNKLTMKQYFSEAAKAYKKDSQAYKLAVREVRRANSTVVSMGDVGGRRKGMLLTPDQMDMKNAKVALEVASKRYEIFNDLVNKGATSLVNWGKNTQWAGRQLTVGLTVPMSIFATKAITAFAEVDKEITRFRKVYGSELTTTVYDSTETMLTQVQALGSEFAKQYGIASSQTIALAADLASAGLEGQTLINGVNQTTRMMVLGEIDRQSAMKATLSLQTAFNMNTKELAQSVDFLNQVENQTSASLQDLTEAIPKAGPVIQALGGDIKDLSVLMTALREGGIASAEGANALKSGLASLISPTTKAIEVSRQFGIDLEGIVKANKGELMPMILAFQDSLRGLDDFGKAKIIEEIFGKYQFARVSALFDNLNQRGSQTVGMLSLMNKSADDLAKQSYSELKAQENAPSTRLAAIQQQLTEQLVKIGADLAETVLPPLQSGLELLSKIVDGFNNLPAPVKNFAKILGTVVSVSGPILMLGGMLGNFIGNAIKFGMSIVNMFKRITGHPVQALQILSDQEMAAKIAAEQLSGAYYRQKTSVDALNKSLTTYLALLRQSSAVAPPGAVLPGGRGPLPPVRRRHGGIIYAQNGLTDGQINGYGGGDKVPALLEPGEFVINKESSKKFAPMLRSINNGTYGQFNGGLTPKIPGEGNFVSIEGAVAATLDSAGARAKANENLLNPTAKKKIVETTTYLESKYKDYMTTTADEVMKYLDQIMPSATEAIKSELRAQLTGPMIGADRSHMADFYNLTTVKGRNGMSVSANAKEFVGTTIAEYGGYNKFINDFGKIAQRQEVWDAINANLKKAGLAPFNPQQIREYQTLLSQTGTQISISERMRMSEMFNKLRDGLKNPAVATDLLNVISNNSRNNAAKAVAAMLYDSKIMKAIETNVYDKVLKEQFMVAQEASLGSSFGKNRALIEATFDRISPSLISSGMGAAEQRTLALLSEVLGGRKVYSKAQLDELQRQGTLIVDKRNFEKPGGQSPARIQVEINGEKRFVPIDIKASGGAFRMSQITPTQFREEILKMSAAEFAVYEERAMQENERIAQNKKRAAAEKRAASKFIRRKNGGIIPRFSEGGKLPGYGGGDVVPAMLEPGEFVINKKATKDNMALLEGINSGNVQKRQNGGIIRGYAGGGQVLGQAAGVFMNLAFLPMMWEMSKETQGTMGQILKAVVIIQGLVGAMQVASLAKNVGSSALGKLQNLRLQGSLLTGGAVKGGTMNALKGQGVKAAFNAAKAAPGATTLSSIATAAGVATGPLLAAGAAVAAIGVGLYMWRKRVDEVAKGTKNLYSEATEMAKVYNIELNSTAAAYSKLQKAAVSLGQATVSLGKGQIEKDYAKAVTKQYGDGIDRIKDMETQQDKLNGLTAIYTSLITQGFNAEQAKEITAEIARQAEATQSLNADFSMMAGKVGEDIPTAMKTMVAATTEVVGSVAEIEAQVEALNGTWENLVRVAAKEPLEFQANVQTLFTTVGETNPESVRQMMQTQIDNMGLGGTDSAANNVLSGIDLGTEQGRLAGADFMNALVNQMDPKFIEEHWNSASQSFDAEFYAELQLNIGMNESKKELDKQMQAIIDDTEKQIEATNDYYDKQIEGIEGAIKAEEKAHEKVMENIQKQADALQKKRDIIEENADFYIKQLEKEYQAESYYQKQRETAIGGLQSLSQGDLFGYLQAQQQSASDAAQYGREQAINQIEDTKDLALKAIDGQMKANQELGDAAQKAFDDDIQSKRDSIESLNKARSLAVKGLKDYIDMAQAVIDKQPGDDAAKDLQKLEDKGLEVAKIVPPKVKEALVASSVNIVENFDTSIKDVTQRLANQYGLNKDEAYRLYMSLLGVQNPEIKRPKNISPGTWNLITGGTKQTEKILGGDTKNTDFTDGDPGNTRKKQTYEQVSSLPSLKFGSLYGQGDKVTLNGQNYVAQFSTKTGGLTWVKMNRGGRVKPMKYNRGVVEVPGFGYSDKVAALLTPGETVVDKVATQRNRYALSAMNAGVSFDTPNTNSYGKLTSANINNSSVDVGGVNININANNMTPAQLEKSVIKALDKAVSSMETGR